MKVLIILFAFYIPIVHCAQEVTIYTYDVLPPLAFRDENKKLTGVYIEIVKRAVERMPKYKLNFSVVPWSRAKEYAKKGKAFAILPPYFHAHDWLTDKDPKIPYLWPYSLPLFTQSDVVICDKNSLKTTPIHFPIDYTKYSFVMWRGDGRAGPEFDELVKKKKIKVTYVDSLKQVAKMLLVRRADCTVTSKLAFAWWVKKAKEEKRIMKAIKAAGVKLITTKVLVKNEGFLGYTNIDDEKNFPFKEDFAQKFDIEIYKMKKSGEISKIISEFVD